MNMQIGELKFEIMLTSAEIQQRVNSLAAEINLAYSDKTPVFIGVLNGCFMFMADLMKEITVPCEMSFVKLASYEGTNQAAITELIGVGIDLKDRDIIIVEDIVDTGKSLMHTLGALSHVGARSIQIASLLVKPTCVEFEFPMLTYVGFEISREFVVGYGLDLDGKWRNLKDIYKNVPA